MNSSDRAQTIAFYDKYLAFAQQMHISFDSSASLKKVADCVLRGDFYLNAIPLRQWDAYHGHYGLIAAYAGIKSWSLSESVCTAKVAALRAALKQITSKQDNPPALDSGESILVTLENLENTNTRYRHLVETIKARPAQTLSSFKKGDLLKIGAQCCKLLTLHRNGTVTLEIIYASGDPGLRFRLAQSDLASPITLVEYDDLRACWRSGFIRPASILDGLSDALTVYLQAEKEFSSS